MPDLIQTIFRRIVRQADVGHVRFHDLRHTHATQLLRLGANAKIVSERLGHSTIGITLDTYSHVLPGMQEDAARRIDAALGAVVGLPVPNAGTPTNASDLTNVGKMSANDIGQAAPVLPENDANRYPVSR